LKILITGANGFIGSSLCKSLSSFNIIKAERHNWSDLIAGVDCVIHLASLAHAHNKSTKELFVEYRSVNVIKTLAFAKNAISAGVKRFIFISSIKVNGEFTKAGIKYSPNDIPAPQNIYAKSKLEAEEGLRVIAESSNMELVIVRLPLVYGPGVRANFLSMMDNLQRGLPLPFANIDNKRSFVFIDNVIDLLNKLIEHPKAAGETFLVSDDEDVSTSNLLLDISRELGCPVKLIYVPQWLLIFIFKAMRRDHLRAQLLESMQIDIEKTKELLNWTPPVKYLDGIKKTVRAYLENNQTPSK
jgi:nucleoside-diphosphate-sugar epimerase